MKASISNEILKQYGLYKPADLPKDIYTFDSIYWEESQSPISRPVAVWQWFERYKSEFHIWKYNLNIDNSAS